MSDLITNVDNDKKLFRFVSLFDLYEILVNGRLRFSKLSTFNDKNEGVGHILQFQEHELFRYSYLSDEKILEAHEYMLNNRYLCCWTGEPDMVAMWALYSPDCSSIRISTTAGKLLRVLQNLDKEYNWANFKSEAGTRRHVSWYYKLRSVVYVDFVQIRDEIRRKYQEFDKYASKKNTEDKTYYERGDGFQKDLEELNSNKIVKEDGLFLKDRSYQHEVEVRTALYCGVRNELTLEEWRRMDDPMRQLFCEARRDELPNYIYAKVDESFLDEVCFDPRMPNYRKDILIQMFKDKIPKLGTSKAFGYVLEQESFASNSDGYAETENT